MGHSELFRIPTEVIFAFSKSKTDINNAVEKICKKPLSDGIRTDYKGNVYITDSNIKVYTLYLLMEKGLH